MSGGAMDYVYGRIYDLSYQENDPIIKKLLIDLSEYLHAEEWWLSGDTCKETYMEERKKFKDKWIKLDSKVNIDEFISEELERVKKELYEALDMKWYDENGEEHEYA